MMRAFEPDSRFMAGLTSFAEAVVVNVLFVLTSLPIVTIGAALSAAHGTLLEATREEGSRPAATYLRYFRQTWKPASAAWLVLLPVFGLLLLEYRVIGVMDGGAAGVVAQAMVLTGIILVALVALWVFPVISQGHGFRASLRLAARLSVKRLPLSVAGFAVHLLPILVLVFWPQAFGGLIYAMLTIGFAFVIYSTDLILARWIPTNPQP